ncbi:MAG TPA: tryptophan--tRNA ligase [Spirochaetota bacterium]
MPRVLSGIQPSGTLHIGNYFAMMKPMIESQSANELFCFIVNYHALTSLEDPVKLRTNTIEAAIDFLALGLDPQQCYFWVQSDIPEVQELTWFLACQTSLGLLDRSHSYKDKLAKGLTASAGLYTYPVLMASDILMLQANIVPVGKDQKQHLEIARDIALRFNHIYGDTFTIPEPRIDDNVAVIPGLDGQKMSKSYGNTIEIFEEEKSLRKKIMSIKTDSTPVEEPKNPDTCNLFSLYSLVATDEQREDMRKRYLAGGTGYGAVKTELFERMRDYFAPYREKRNALAADKDGVRKILRMGADKTREVAMKTINTVRERVGINY